MATRTQRHMIGHTARLLATVLGAINLLQCTKAPPIAPPELPARSLFTPIFETNEGSRAAGTAYLLRVSGRNVPLLLTAHHLFGPDGGFSVQWEWDELAMHVRSFAAISLQEPTLVINGGRPLTLRWAQPMSLGSNGPDVAAFVPDSAWGTGLTLAEKRPEPGSRVWLAARAAAGAPPEQLLHSGYVIDSPTYRLELRLDDAKLDLRGASGGPIIDARGKVVGMLGGIATTSDGIYSVMAVPVEAIRDLLVTSEVMKE